MNHLKHVKKIGKEMEKSKVNKWVKKYKKKNPDGTFGWLYGSDILQKLIELDGCDGIWFFKGINDDGEEKLIMYPADHDGNILNRPVKSLGAMAGGGGGQAADDSEACPPYCPELD